METINLIGVFGTTFFGVLLLGVMVGEASSPVKSETPDVIGFVTAWVFILAVFVTLLFV